MSGWCGFIRASAALARHLSPPAFPVPNRDHSSVSPLRSQFPPVDAHPLTPPRQISPAGWRPATRQSELSTQRWHIRHFPSSLVALGPLPSLPVRALRLVTRAANQGRQRVASRHHLSRRRRHRHHPHHLSMLTAILPCSELRRKLVTNTGAESEHIGTGIPSPSPANFW